MVNTTDLDISKWKDNKRDANSTTISNVCIFSQFVESAGRVGQREPRAVRVRGGKQPTRRAVGRPAVGV